MANKTDRIRIFQETLSMCEHHERLKRDVNRSILKQKIYWEEDSIEVVTPRFNTPAQLFLSSKRTVEAAGSSKYIGKTIGILNFASSINPGGGVWRGTTTQEEGICRISSLYPAISDPKSAGAFYQNHRNWIRNGSMGRKNRNDCIYTPGVTVFRKDDFECSLLPEEEWFQVDVLTCAAPDQRYDGSENPFRPTEVALEQILTERIEMIIKIAAFHHVDVLILGAFGCGAFGNPPHVVANAFEQVISKYRYHFEVIEFAVYSTRKDDVNYLAFSKISGIM